MGRWANVRFEEVERLSPILPEYFRRRIAVVRSGCWEWAGGTWQQGYGRVSEQRAAQYGTRFAHRCVFALTTGQAIPPGMSVCHSCDNPKCVNPDHLWLGTHIENMHDKEAKGRGRWGRDIQSATHCRHGHEYTPETTYVWSGRKHCRVCNNEATKRYKLKTERADNG